MAGAGEVGVFFGEAEAEQVLAAAGAEEGGAGDGGDAGGGEQVCGPFGGGGAGDAGGVGEDVVGAGRNRGRKAGAVRAWQSMSRLAWYSVARSV